MQALLTRVLSLMCYAVAPETACRAVRICAAFKIRRPLNEPSPQFNKARMVRVGPLKPPTEYRLGSRPPIAISSRMSPTETTFQRPLQSDVSTSDGHCLSIE